MIREAVIDANKCKLISIGDLRLEGECLRCAKCCMPPFRPEQCPDLQEGTLDGKQHYACGVHFSHPWHCAFFPLPENKIEGCGFRWVK